MSTDEKKKPKSDDDTKRDQVLKRLLGTPPQPKKPAPQKSGSAASKGQG